MIVPVPQFTQPAYTEGTANSAAQGCVNLVVERSGDESILVTRPGLTLFTTATNNQPCKGMYTAMDRIFSVHSTKLYEIASNGTVTDRGTLSGLGDFVEMADNGSQLMIRGDTAGWIFTLGTNVLTQITDLNYPAVTRGLVSKDSYFIVTSYPTGRIYVSALSDGTDWTPVSFATAEEDGDYLGGLATLGQELYLIGTRTTERWYNTGNPSFTFERVNGGTFNVGTYYPWSIAKQFDSIFLVAESHGHNVVWRLNGGGQQRISTPFIEKSIRNLNPIRGICVSDNGHSYYVLSSYSANKQSWAYDLSTGTWSQWSSYKNSNQEQWRINASTPGFGGTTQYNLCGDSENGKIYYLTGNDEVGVDITRTRIFGPIRSGSKRVFHKQIRFEFEAAYDSGASSISALLSWSDDGGLTYSSAITLTKTITNTTSGQRITMLQNRLGPSIERVYKLVFVGPTARLILKKCELDLEEGRF